MYTLLLVDDALYTRRGLLKMLPLQQLNITKVIEADDGVDALKKIENEFIDIVLTDVKMPRMDGVDMSIEIRKKYPNCIIIFMSGYSDEAILRSAIKLRAIHYVDKPIDSCEIIKVLEEAVLLCSNQNETIEIVDNQIKHQLVLDLTKNTTNHSEIVHKLKFIHIDVIKITNSLTFIIKIFPDSDLSDEFLFSMQTYFLSTTDLILSDYSIAYLRTFKDNYTLVCNILQIDKNVTIASKKWQLMLFTKLSDGLKQYNHFIAVGIPVGNYLHLNNSYQSAVSNLQQNFFTGVNSITFRHKKTLRTFSISMKTLVNFETCVINKEKINALQIIDSLYQAYQKYSGTSISQIKQDYFQLFLRVVALSKRNENVNLIWDTISNLHTLSELNCFIIDYINAHFKVFEESNKQPIPTLIYDYIHMHCFEYDFSIDNISDALHLNPTYLSYVFKQETDQTINNYVTKYRVDQAKRYLPDYKYKISDISSLVGYRDNNYFTKVFKRSTGMTPSEFRSK